MKIRSQIGMVLNLDKCIGCHTCSITCKNVWTSREGMEYAWFNNVESKPGIGYPKEWENQDKWNGGWVRKADGEIQPRIGGKFRILANIFANPDLPQIDDYYEPFDYDYQHLHTAPIGDHMPTARPRSLITGKRMEKIVWGPNWEEILGTEFAKRSKDKNFDNMQKEMYGEFENTFMMYLPRLCEHCLNPACAASCPSGAIYKREEDGIVLIDQEKCRGWRMCISGCPYKKIYFNWKSGKSEKCIFCYPRIEAGQPTVCSETCVGRIRYLGVLLYDADRIKEVASTPSETDLYEKQLEIFLDPNDPEVIAQARKDGIAESVIESAQKSPVYKLAVGGIHRSILRSQRRQSMPPPSDERHRKRRSRSRSRAFSIHRSTLDEILRLRREWGTASEVKRVTSESPRASPSKGRSPSKTRKQSPRGTKYQLVRRRRSTRELALGSCSGATGPMPIRRSSRSRLRMIRGS